MGVRWIDVVCNEKNLIGTAFALGGLEVVGSHCGEERIDQLPYDGTNEIHQWFKGQSRVSQENSTTPNWFGKAVDLGIVEI